MKWIHVFLIILFSTALSVAQNSIDEELQQKLDTILYTDQTLRELFNNTITEKRKDEILKEFGYTQNDFKEGGWNIVQKQDSLNLLEIEHIISKYGYPGKSLVGEPTNEAAWYVIQHSNEIEKYFPMIQKAGDADELSKRLVAMMQDRLLSNRGEEQIYGTQVSGKKINVDGEEDQWFYYVWPIKNPGKVNELRKQLGFELTVEENAKRLGVDYKPYTMKQIDAILNPK